MGTEHLHIHGARQNNLKGISLKIPHNQVTVITGVSGSGKSSLAFDTLFAEGQWRYVESLSTYARLFLEKVDRPNVDRIENIRPAIAIQQKNPVRNARSTVGTSTEIYDHLRLLFAKIGRTWCSGCGEEVKAYSPSEAARELVEKFRGARALILFAMPETPPQDLPALLEGYARKGFIRLKVQDQVINFTQEPLSKLKIHPSDRCFVVVDRIQFDEAAAGRIADSVEIAFENGAGEAVIETADHAPVRFGSGFRCHQCGLDYEKPHPLLFSFNHPTGACPECKGFGQILKYDEDKIVPDKSKSLIKGAIEPWTKPSYRSWYRQLLAAAKSRRINIQKPWGLLTPKEQSLIFKGTKQFKGIHSFFEHLEGKRYKLHVRVFLSRYRSQFPCPGCRESRLKSQTLQVKVGGFNIHQFSSSTVEDALEWISSVPFTPYEESVAHELIRQLRLKLGFLRRVGLNYLTLNRLTRTLSGGEAQRINLANQLGSGLAGTLYVLDEPSIGLHPRDTQVLIDMIHGLAEASNTVVVVEHDRQIIEAADYLVELGPRGGEKGGEVVFSGPFRNFSGNSDTLTATYLRDTQRIPTPRSRRKGNGLSVTLTNVREHNLKGFDLKVPLGLMVCVTGVSGSGKSSLIHDTLYRALARAFRIDFQRMGRFDRLSGIEHIKGIRLIDQEPIGRTPRSNPITYIKAFDEIRNLFAGLPEARRHGFSTSHFSFNTVGGRCETCQGNGFERLEMFFFEDIFATCPACEGRRYKPAILRVKYRGLDIGQILNMTVDEALTFFDHIPKLARKFKVMSEVGLGYARLGQPATTLSGGEAQRLKICLELSQSRIRDYLFILDEPTTGLHFQDVEKLLRVLANLVDAGNTVIVIEHNLDVIKSADWIIDLGPEGGHQGGQIVAQGTPEDIIEAKGSHTGNFLKNYLSPSENLSASAL